jgi:hypothetical protein
LRPLLQPYRPPQAMRAELPVDGLGVELMNSKNATPAFGRAYCECGQSVILNADDSMNFAY